MGVWQPPSMANEAANLRSLNRRASTTSTDSVDSTPSTESATSSLSDRSAEIRRSFFGGATTSDSAKPGANQRHRALGLGKRRGSSSCKGAMPQVSFVRNLGATPTSLASLLNNPKMVRESITQSTTSPNANEALSEQKNARLAGRPCLRRKLMLRKNICNASPQTCGTVNTRSALIGQLSC